MSVLGKILAVLNVLGVCAVLVIGGMAYSKRQTWAYYNQRAELLTKGFPLDETELDPNDGVPLVNKLHAKTVTDLLGGPPSKDGPTLVGEIKRAKGELDSKLADETDTQKKIGVYTRLLLPMTGNPYDREYLLSVQTFLETEKGFDELKERLAAAMPPAVDSFCKQYENKQPQLQKLHFERELFDAVEKLPGDPKRRLVYAFLLKMSKSELKFNESELSAAELAWGLPPINSDQTAERKASHDSKLPDKQGEIKKIQEQLDAMDKAFDKAGKAAQAEMTKTEEKRKELPDAEKKFDDADSEAFKAEIEYRKDPVPAKLKARNDAVKAKTDAQAILVTKQDAHKKYNLPPVDGAQKFLETLRPDLKEKVEPGTAEAKIKSYMKLLGNEVLEMIEADLTERYEEAFKAATTGKWTAPDSGVVEEAIDPAERRLLIARLLFVSLEELNPEEFKKALEQSDKSLYDTDVPAFKRFIRLVGARTAVEAINAESLRVVNSGEGLREEMTAESRRFYKDYSDAIIRLRGRADQIDQLDKRLERVVNQGSFQKGLADFQILRVGQFRTELKTKRDETAKEVKRLQDLSDGLYQVRVAYRDAVRDQQKHLENIVALEEQILYLQGQIEAKERELKKRKSTRP